jgi:hypothetical protein
MSNSGNKRPFPASQGPAGEAYEKIPKFEPRKKAIDLNVLYMLYYNIVYVYAFLVVKEPQVSAPISQNGNFQR